MSNFTELLQGLVLVGQRIIYTRREKKGKSPDGNCQLINSPSDVETMASMLLRVTFVIVAYPR